MELLIIIVVLGIAAASLTMLSTRSAELSASVARSASHGLANALLEEVKAMPFTYCDPNDANAGTAPQCGWLRRPT